MKYLWTYLDRQSWRAAAKYRIVLLVLGALFALIGFALWLVVRCWALATWDWMICFTGYPIVFSWFFVLLYSCEHDFHNGKPRRKNY